MELFLEELPPQKVSQGSPGTKWTLVLTGDAADDYLACVSEHASHSEDCWVEWTETTLTLKPSTVTSDIFVSVTAALLSAVPSTNSSTSSSTSNSAMPISTATVPVPTATPLSSSKAKSSPAFRKQSSRPLLFLALLSLLVPMGWRVIGA